MTDIFHFFKGRVALYAILKAAGVGPGDEVVLPGYTCVVVPNAVMYLGARPVYADIDPETYNVDPASVAEKITDRTRAVIGQHTYGVPVDMDALSALAKARGALLIEDSCHAVGSTYKGREAGTMGDAAFFSSQWSKPLTTGLGGWARVNDPKLAEKLRALYPSFKAPGAKESAMLRLQYLAYSLVFRPSLFWFAQDTYRALASMGLALGSSSKKELDCEMPEDYAKRMAPWQVAMIEKKLADAARMLAYRRRAAALYDRLLRERGIKPLVIPEGSDPVVLRYPVRVRDKEEALAKAREARVELGDWFASPVHPNMEGWERSGYEKGTCPNAEDAALHVVNLPTHTGMDDGEVERTVDVIAPFCAP